jgi:hypothetical protein
LNSEIASYRLLVDWVSPWRDGRQPYEAGENIADPVNELHLSWGANSNAFRVDNEELGWQSSKLYSFAKVEFSTQRR